MHDAGITPHRLTYQEDARLVDFGVGLTNIAARATRSSSDLDREDFSRGSRTLAKKISRFEPKGVAFVGITAFREFQRSSGVAGRGQKLRCGRQPDPIQGAAVFVLPNPSGRNAHYSYRDMLHHYRHLAKWMKGSDA